jgi:hypothetical protein
MADEIQGSQGFQGAPSPSPAPSSTGDTPEIGAKLQATPGTTALKDLGRPAASGPTGQGAVPPAKAPEGVPSVEPAKPATPTWDAAHEQWLKSKGMDLTKFDPANDAHVQLVKNAINAESAMTKAQQEAKARAAQPPRQPAPPPPPVASSQAAKIEGPLAEFEAIHAYERKQMLARLGVTEADLRAQRPDILEQWDREYVIERQKAWESEQVWKQEQATKQQREAAEEARMADSLRKTEEAMAQNFTLAKAKNPEVEAAFQRSGVDKVFQFLDNELVVPKAFILHNPEVFDWFMKAATALDYMNPENEARRKESWTQEYEKSLQNARSAQMPSMSGSSPAPRNGSQTSMSGHWTQRMAAATIR